MANRIVNIEIAGTQYPLNFSIKAAKEVTKRYGALEKVADVFEKKTEDELFDELMFLLALLLDQGARYKEIVNGEKVRTFTADELEVVMGSMDCIDLKSTLMSAMAAGSEQSIKLEESETEKNAETTQGQ